ncbi:MAG: efflux RND transporter periplasmic adaptor subunit [Spirochaetaceae bacterium]|nr:MAG: efflux RND transporter periplasmic adaptor subunit [Spirochaetaceae bacterium]
MTTSSRPTATCRSVRARRLVLAAAIAGVLLAATGCRPARSSRDSADAPEPVFAVEARPIRADGIRDYVSLNGEVEAASSVDVFASAGGQLIEITAAVGDRVARDQVIARVDPSRPGQVFSPSPVEAPIAGTITRLSARAGALVTPQQPIARIATTDELRLVTAVPERFIGALAPGQNAIVRFDAFPDRTYRARVIRLAPTLDQQARTLEVTLGFLNRDALLRPGLFARIELTLSERPAALTVPRTAVVVRGGQPNVFVVNDDSRATLVPVVLGAEAGGRVELRSGVAAGDRVVTRGQNLLDDGALLRVIDIDEAE